MLDIFVNFHELFGLLGKLMTHFFRLGEQILKVVPVFLNNMKVAHDVLDQV